MLQQKNATKTQKKRCDSSFPFENYYPIITEPVQLSFLTCFPLYSYQNTKK